MRRLTPRSRLSGPSLARKALFLSVLAAANAGATPAPKWRSTFEADAGEVLSAWIQDQLLHRKLERTRQARSYDDHPTPPGRPRPNQSNVGDVVSAPASIGAAFGVWYGSSSVVVGEATGKEMRFFFRVSLPQMGVASAVVTVAALGANVGSALSSNSTSGGEPDSSIGGDGTDEIDYSLRRGRYRKPEFDPADHNAALQAAFVADLKKTSSAISERLAKTYGVPETARRDFDRAIEKRLFEGFSANKVWTEQTRVTVGVREILRRLVNDVEGRIELVDQAVRAGRAAKLPETKAEARAAYDGMIRETETIVSGFREAQRVFGEDSDPAVASALRELKVLAAEQEELGEKLKLHQKLVR